jgi:1-acyl-sn-glycerol-3-phosphate acyltransferase
MKILDGMSYSKGILPFLCIVANLCFWLVPLVFLTLLKSIIPARRFQDLLSWLMEWVYRLAVWCDDPILFRIIGIRLEVEGIAAKYPDKFYLIIANHQSWNDILILQHLFNRKAPILKFLVKRELIYLPIVGLICWAYDYPFLTRRSVRGFESPQVHSLWDFWKLEKALDKFSRYPASVVNMAEGTRFTREKARIHNSPYKHLLKPRAGGLTTILGLLGDRISAILDVTIVYDCPHPSFWNFLCGKCRRVIVRVKEHAPKEIARVHDFDKLAEWLKGVWEKKDLEIERIRQDLTRAK